MLCEVALMIAQQTNSILRSRDRTTELGSHTKACLKNITLKKKNEINTYIKNSTWPMGWRTYIKHTWMGAERTGTWNWGWRIKKEKNKMKPNKRRALPRQRLSVMVLGIRLTQLCARRSLKKRAGAGCPCVLTHATKWTPNTAGKRNDSNSEHITLCLLENSQENIPPQTWHRISFIHKLPEHHFAKLHTRQHTHYASSKARTWG